MRNSLRKCVCFIGLACKSVVKILKTVLWQETFSNEAQCNILLSIDMNTDLSSYYYFSNKQVAEARVYGLMKPTLMDVIPNKEARKTAIICFQYDSTFCQK